MYDITAEANPLFLLATRVDKMSPSCPLGNAHSNRSRARKNIGPQSVHVSSAELCLTRLLIIKQVKCYFFISAARCYKNTLSFLSIIFVFLLKKNKQTKQNKKTLRKNSRTRTVQGCDRLCGPVSCELKIERRKRKERRSYVS